MQKTRIEKNVEIISNAKDFLKSLDMDEKFKTSKTRKHLINEFRISKSRANDLTRAAIKQLN